MRGRCFLGRYTPPCGGGLCGRPEPRVADRRDRAFLFSALGPRLRQGQ